MADGFTTSLAKGFASLLATAGVGVYSETDPYAAGDIGITFGKLPASPDVAISLKAYSLTDDPSLSDSVFGLQVMCRAAGFADGPTDDLADAVFDQLHGMQQTLLSSGVTVAQCLHHGGGSLGQDDLNRWVRSDTYYVTVWRPSLHRY